MSGRHAIGLLLALLLAGCAAPPVPPVSPPAPPITPVATFTASLEALTQSAHLPGLSVAVVEDGKVVLLRGFGFADLAARVPATADTPYDIASVSKTLSAVVALRLVELGKLDLDRRMATYKGFDDFCQGSRAQGGIFFKDYRCATEPLTLRHVLSMTANGTVGERFFYNPISYSWASRPMAEVTGTPFSTLVAEHVFAPAGMTRSARRHRALPLPPEIAAALAKPYHLGSDGTLVPSAGPGPQGDGAAGGVISTVRDLARFDLALDGGRLLSAASRAAMWSPGRSSSGRTLPYGLGWFVEDYRGERLLWHSGWWEKAWSALYLKIPARHLTLILLANSEGLWWDNPLDGAEVEKSPFAAAFFAAFTPRAPRGDL
jgi:CubicO group peptidase (beta-lactamase class C family)